MDLCVFDFKSELRSFRVVIRDVSHLIFFTTTTTTTTTTKTTTTKTKTRRKENCCGQVGGRTLKAQKKVLKTHLSINKQK